VNQNKPNNNFGTATTLSVRSTTTGNPENNYRTLVRFNLSSLPSGATILSATLRLRMNQAPSASRSYDAYRVTASWSETTITWNNQPAVAAGATSTTDTGTTSDVWLEWNVTSDVQAFISGSQGNFGWRIKDQIESASGDFQSTFGSREATDTEHDPRLVIVYQP